MESTDRRGYRMGQRAETTAETGERILDAAADVFWENPTDQISLDEVARRADVSVRTVIRRFGGMQGLLAAGSAREVQRTRSERERVPVGNAAAAAALLVDLYEKTGDRTMKMLAEEERSPSLRPIVDMGRDVHRDWCTRVFAPALTGLTGAERRRRLAQFVAVCDVFTWKLLRRDAGLSRRQTELALTELLSPMLEEH